MVSLYLFAIVGIGESQRCSAGRSPIRKDTKYMFRPRADASQMHIVAARPSCLSQVRKFRNKGSISSSRQKSNTAQVGTTVRSFLVHRTTSYEQSSLKHSILRTFVSKSCFYSSFSIVYRDFELLTIKKEIQRYTLTMKKELLQ